MAPPAEPLYVFVHVSKVGGTTVEDVLARRFGRHLQRTNPRPGGRRWPHVPDPRCIAGHGVEQELARIGAHGDVRWLSWVRDPFRTAVSTYYYTRDVLVPQHPPGTFFVDRGLYTWLVHDEPGGWPLPPGYGHERMTATITGHGVGLDEFAFVGVTERFAESMLLMFRVLGWAPMPYRALNPTRSRPSPTEQAVLDDPEVRAVFRARNAADYALYDRAVARLDALRLAEGPGFPAALADYERTVARRERWRRLLLENPATDALRRAWRAVYNRRMRAAVQRAGGGAPQG